MPHPKVIFKVFHAANPKLILLGSVSMNQSFVQMQDLFTFTLSFADMMKIEVIINIGCQLLFENF